MTLKEFMKQAVAGLFVLLLNMKLWMTLVGISIMWGIYWHTAYHLSASIPAEKLQYLAPIINDLYQTMMWGVVTAVGLYLGFTTLDKFTRTTSTANQIISSIINKKVESKEEITYREELERGD